MQSVSKILAFEGISDAVDIYFMRHGESAGNKENLVQGHTDLPLTDLGRKQAVRAGAWLATKNISHLCSSPLSRALETAQIASSFFGNSNLTIDVLDGLKEIDTGIFSARTFKEIEASQAQVYHQFRAQSWQAVPGAEKIVALETRALEHWHYLVSHANAGHKSILSVSHGGFLQWLLRTSIGLGHESWMPLFHFNNCGVSHLHLEALAKIDDNQHPGVFAEWRLINFVGFLQ